jgi:hypothetical protein
MPALLKKQSMRSNLSIVRLHVTLHVRRFGDVGRHRYGLPAVLTDDAGARLRSRGVAVHHGNLRAVARERHGRCAADAVATSGDQRNLAGEIHLTILSDDLAA